jgi:hypothetical protein
MINRQESDVKRYLLAALLAGASLQANAIGRLADVSIVDQDTGAVLPTHYYHGEYWVEGIPGARYAISIRNRLGERLLAVTAVDGVNVISGDGASWSQTGYVFGPYVGYQVDGWRKSNAEVAAFEFAAASGSYAVLTGRPANVGVIGIALFRERPAPPIIAQSDMAAAPSADRVASNRLALPAPMPQEKLGTAHGEREESRVVQTDFQRLRSTPDELIRIRYDSLPNLIAMGVIKRAPSPSPSPDPFPNSPLARYVPDPPQSR